jgi:hypothetical protein
MAVSVKSTVFWDVMLQYLVDTNISGEPAASIFRVLSTLKKKAAVLINIYQTVQHHTPDDSILYTP